MSTNINAKANLIWEVATKLVGVYKPHEYGKVILPMTVLKRFDDILKPTKQAVLEKYEEVKNFEVKEMFLTEASGYSPCIQRNPYLREVCRSSPKAMHIIAFS